VLGAGGGKGSWESKNQQREGADSLDEWLIVRRGSGGGVCLSLCSCPSPFRCLI
jgi:hypothetical protein